MIKKALVIVTKLFPLISNHTSTDVFQLKKRSVLIILTPGFPSSESDTTCLPMQQAVVKTLKEQYPETKIIVCSFQYPYHKQTYKWNGITVMSFNGQNKPGITRWLLRIKLTGILQKINRSHRIIGLFSFWYGECALVGKRFADKHSHKHYCWILGQDAKKENRYPRKIRAGATELVALSDFLQDEFEKNNKVRPQFVIPPGIENTYPALLSKEKNIDILAVGSLIPLKCFDVFIENIAAIKKQYPQITTMLVGNGPEREKLNHLIIKNGLEKNCVLSGELEYDKVMELMRHSRILMHPSSYEGFSGVCQEALFSGAHVISFCRAMKREIAQWHIVADKEAMQTKALQILQDAGTKYHTVQPFTIHETAAKIMSLFTG